MRTTNKCVLGFLCLLIHAAGCSSDPSPTSASTGTGESTATTGAGGDTATSTGTGTPTGTGGSAACLAPMNNCSAPDQCGPIVPYAATMQPFPTGLGGVVQDGTYWLKSLIMHLKPGVPYPDQSGLGIGSTFVLSGGTFQESSTNVAPGLPVDTDASSGTFVTSANLFTEERTCSVVPGVTEGSYTANGKTLTLYIPYGGLPIELVYTKQ